VTTIFARTFKRAGYKYTEGMDSVCEETILLGKCLGEFGEAINKMQRGGIVGELLIQGEGMAKGGIG
jgi:hypothetical protein